MIRNAQKGMRVRLTDPQPGLPAGAEGTIKVGPSRSRGRLCVSVEWDDPTIPPYLGNSIPTAKLARLPAGKQESGTVPQRDSLLTPFANETETVTIGELNIENRKDRVSIFGSIDVTRDMEGLTKALAIKKVVDAVVAALQAESLPDNVETRPTSRVMNPF